MKKTSFENPKEILPMKRSNMGKIITLCTLISVFLAFFLASCSFVEDEGRSIVRSAINENGELVLYYSDGSYDNVGAVVGADGKDGVDGIDGVNGVDGKDGINGKDGIDGVDGKNGKNGKDGINGVDGKDIKETVIINTDESDVAIAAARGLRSAVSITCAFTDKTTDEEYGSAGSGVIYTLDKTEGDAFIITNYHVVYDVDSETGVSESINVYLYGAEYADTAIEATFVGGSLYYDIAVLRVENSELLKTSPVLEVSVRNSNEISVGDTAIAIGNPMGEGISVTSGIISVDSENIEMTASDDITEIKMRLMRIDTPVNSGNSGGGLFDEIGNLIGIVNAKIIDTGIENIGYAIPSNVAIAIANNIIDYCYGTSLTAPQRALLGITVTISDSKMVYDANTASVSIEETNIVYEVSAGSIAYGKLLAGDILLEASLGGGEFIKLSRQHSLIDLMLDARAGDTVTLKINRGGTEMSVNITVTSDCIIPY